MFGSNSSGLEDPIRDPVHQRPPANSRGSSAMGSAGLPASRYHRLTSVWRSGPVVRAMVTNTGRRLSGKLSCRTDRRLPWILACAAAAR